MRRKKIFRYKVSILLCSFISNMVAPLFAEAVSNKLHAGGQLLSSVSNVTDSAVLSGSYETVQKKLDSVAMQPSGIVAKKVVTLPKRVTVGGQTFTVNPVQPKQIVDQNASHTVVHTVQQSAVNSVAQDTSTHIEAYSEPVSADQRNEQKNDEERVIFNFEDVDLVNVAAYIEKLFGIKLITDEAIKPIAKDGKALSGNKISFKTQKPLTKKQAWGLFVTFLNMSGLSVIPQAGAATYPGDNPKNSADTKFYRITQIKTAEKSAIPVYIGVAPESLPDSEIKIRYGYFVKDCPLETIKNVLESLRSSASGLLILHDHNAFILTDSAYNIKVLMKVVKELDRVTMPQSMSVLKLYKVDAEHVEKIYKQLTQDDKEGTVASRLFGPRLPSKALYFPKNAKMIVESRTNSLILLGTADDIKKIEDFIRDRIDVDINAPYSPLHIYELKYANALDVANIMNNLVKFGDEKVRGGVRAGDKYFRNMSFTGEPPGMGNRLIIRGDYDDYLKVKEVIQEIDKVPDQVAIEILILGVDIQDQRELGAQVRNKFKSPDGTNLNFQTSGITLGASAKGIVVNTNEAVKGSLRLLGDLINLVSGAAAGTTVLSLGSDKWGVWGILGILDQLTNTQVISNPFLTATNNTKARVKLGDTKRIPSSVVISNAETTSFDNYDAFINVEVTPHINSDGMIVMDLIIKFENFGIGSVPSKFQREIKTSIVSANNEIIALGGLLKNSKDDSMSKNPILGDIPILGWLFKNKKKLDQKQDLLVLITPHVIDPEQKVKEFTKRHLKDYKDTVQAFDVVKNRKDPVDRAFFKDQRKDLDLDNFIFTRGEKDTYIEKKLHELGMDKKNKISKKKRRRLKKEVKSKQAKVSSRKSRRKGRRGRIRKEKVVKEPENSIKNKVTGAGVDNASVKEIPSAGGAETRLNKMPVVGTESVESAVMAPGSVL